LESPNWKCWSNTCSGTDRTGRIKSRVTNPCCA
jgi:hypothetical protein